jgi:adenylate cyclase
MPRELLGELVPVGGGDPIPLSQPNVTIGRRESCDIALKAQGVSGNHCELAFQDGVWKVRDLGSSNGTKYKGARLTPNTWQKLPPGEEFKIASQVYKLQYTCTNPAALDEPEEDDWSQSLMEKAGLAKPKGQR